MLGKAPGEVFCKHASDTTYINGSMVYARAPVLNGFHHSQSLVGAISCCDLHIGLHGATSCRVPRVEDKPLLNYLSSESRRYTGGYCFAIRTRSN